ncbi:MAG TPA: DoxX family protein, partial [Candidatus Paceibacterota bacterium]|nr:DoxX family protein [Candidatus Paceibacterota bacterium]
MQKLQTFAPTLLRIGMALLFLWFGTNQFIDTAAWTAYVPQWVVDASPVSVEALVHINGAIEIIFGTALLLGFFTRIAGFILALHMVHIATLVGYNATGVRDFGLAIATIAVWLNGPDAWTLDRYNTRVI